MRAEQNPASAEWRQHWTLVLASMMGLSFTALASTTIGLFMEPLSQEFGWTRAEVSAGLAIYAFIAVPFSPVIGALVDRWGARRLAIPGMIATTFVFACFSLANGSTAQWLGLWAAYSVVALFIRNTVWTTAITSIFSSGRGLALGLTLSGTAVTGTLAPVLAQRLIDSEGWRDGYLWMGLGWGGIALIFLVFFFFDARDIGRLQRSGRAAAGSIAADLPGLTFAEALRDQALIKVGLAATSVFILTGISIHLVPILGERGIGRESAALLAGLAGATAIVGRLGSGWALDRWASGWINFANLAAPAVACSILLLAGDALLWITVAVVILGYASGAFMQVCAYLVGRYGGTRSFGKVFGVISSIVALGLGVGPLLAGLIYDSAGSYTPLLIAAIPVSLLSGFLVSALGPYPQWGERTDLR